MIKTFTVRLLLLFTILYSLPVTASDDPILEGKSPEFVKYYNLGLRYVRFVDQVSSLDEADIKDQISILFAERISKIENGGELLSADYPSQQALLMQLMNAKTSFGKWKLREKSFRFIPSAEIRTTVVYFVGGSENGLSFNTSATLVFDIDDRITEISEAFAPFVGPSL
ncbi:MAG: hypothetical protein K2W94_04460 [Alphaproteobacteria bacterium]|nr:hypothetical protein [Alphaproteobacteria bacterium]